MGVLSREYGTYTCNTCNMYLITLEKYSVKISHRVVTLVSVNSHALQTNQVTLVHDAYLTAHEENGQTNMSSIHHSKESLLQILSHFISKADTCLLAEV